MTAPNSTPSPVALITGASSGIGLAAARKLADHGFRVFAAARRVDKMSDLATDGTVLLGMDLTDDASMVAGVGQVIEQAGRIDVLVNNAGYGSFGAVEQVPIQEARRQFEVNVFAMARLIQLVLPTMRDQGSGRIINLSSVAGAAYQPLAAWYHASKYAVEGLSNSLRVEVKPFGIDVVTIQPGFIRSEWNALARQSLTNTSADGPYARQADQMARLYERADELAASPDMVADRIVLAATAAQPRPHYPVGPGAGLMIGAATAIPDRALDRVLGGLFGGSLGDATLRIDKKVGDIARDDRVQEAGRTARDLLGKARRAAGRHRAD